MTNRLESIPPQFLRGALFAFVVHAFNEGACRFSHNGRVVRLATVEGELVLYFDGAVHCSCDRTSENLPVLADRAFAYLVGDFDQRSKLEQFEPSWN